MEAENLQHDDLESEQALCAFVQNKIKSSESLMEAYHRQWFTNIAMRRGLQYVQTHAGSRVMIMPPESDDRVRMIANKLLGIHQTRLAKIVKDMPRCEVVPGSSQEEDKGLARKGTKQLDWIWQNNQMIQLLKKVYSWAIDVGSCFLYVYWDPTKGPKITTYERHEGPITGQEPYRIDEEGYILDESGERQVKEITQGDVAIDLIPPFDVINDGVSETIEDSSWIIIQQAMSLDDIQMMWPEKGREVKAEKDLSSRAYYQYRLRSLVGNEGEHFTPDVSSKEKMARVVRYFKRPSPKHPNGQVLIVAGGILLDSQEFYNHQEYPLHKFDDIEISGSFWGVGTIENVLPVQKGYNRTLSQIIENANNTANIKIVVSKDSGLQSEGYDDTGTEVLEVNHGTDITQLQPASLPGYIIQLLSIYDRIFEDATGQHEVSQSRAPAGVKSGVAISALLEQDDTRLAPTKLSFYRNLERLASQCLKLYAEFQQEDRTYQIVGETANDIESVVITKADIESMNKDVRVQTENLIAAQKKIQQDRVVELWKMGLFGIPDSPDVRKRVLSILEFGRLGELFEEADADTHQARRENEQFISKEGLIPLPDMKSGMDAMSLAPYSFEDHETHIRVHNQLRKSPRYYQMSAPERRGIDLHVELHENFLKPPAPPLPPPGARPLGPPVGQMGTGN